MAQKINLWSYQDHPASSMLHNRHSPRDLYTIWTQLSHKTTQYLQIPTISSFKHVWVFVNHISRSRRYRASEFDSDVAPLYVRYTSRQSTPVTTAADRSKHVYNFTAYQILWVYF